MKLIPALVRGILSCLKHTRSCLEKAEDEFSTARRKVATATRQKKGPTRMSLIDMRGKRVVWRHYNVRSLLVHSMNAFLDISKQDLFSKLNL